MQWSQEDNLVLLLLMWISEVDGEKEVQEIPYK